MEMRIFKIEFLISSKLDLENLTNKVFLHPQNKIEPDIYLKLK
jgi:hypothetical protein